MRVDDKTAHLSFTIPFQETADKGNVLFSIPILFYQITEGETEKDSLKKHEKPTYRKLIYEKYIKFAKAGLLLRIR